MIRPRATMRQRLADGETLVGTFANLGSALAVEACCVAGLDWVLIDLEHGGGHEAALPAQLVAAALHGTHALVRVEQASRPRAGRPLDLGAEGIMFPRIETLAEARAAVAHLRYAGDRGVATYNRACRFGTDPGAIREADERMLGVMQVESPGAVEAARDIAALDGVDVLFVGPGDLSHAMGCFGALDDRRFRDAVEHVVGAAEDAGKAAGILVARPDQVAAALDDGFRMVGIGSDSTLLVQAAQAAAAAARAVPAP